MIDRPANNKSHSHPDSAQRGYELIDDSKQGYFIAAEPGPGEE